MWRRGIRCVSLTVWMVLERSVVAVSVATGVGVRECVVGVGIVALALCVFRCLLKLSITLRRECLIFQLTTTRRLWRPC